MRRLIKPCRLHCIKINDIGVKFAEQTALEHVNLHIHCGALAAVIGKNGAGKSTLIRAILDDIPHKGTIEFKDHKKWKYAEYADWLCASKIKYRKKRRR